MIDDTPNGILGRVPGPCISDALRQLPPVESAEDRDYDVVIDAEHVGPVRIFARKQLARHRKHSHWFWLATRAEAVE